MREGADASRAATGVAMCTCGSAGGKRTSGWVRVTSGRSSLNVAVVSTTSHPDARSASPMIDAAHNLD